MAIDTEVLTRINRIFGLAALLAGLGVLAGGSVLIRRMHLNLLVSKSAAIADGIVIENHAKEVSPQPGSRELPYTSYQAVVRFKDEQGRMITFADSFGFNHASFARGQTVRVIYDPQDPQQAMIDRGEKDYIVPGIVLFFGVVLIAGGLQHLAGGTPVTPSATVTAEIGRR